MTSTRTFPVRHRVGDIDFSRASPNEAASALVGLALDPPRSGIHVHLANAYTIALANKSPQYKSSLSGEVLNFSDGKPIGWVSKLRGDTLPLVQVRGPKLFLDVIESGLESNVRHFLLGSTPEVLSSLESNLRTRFPSVIIAGTMSPPFRVPTELELVDRDTVIRESRAQIVWVGLGTPKQDYEARRLAQSLNIVSIAIGAAFDFAAGTQPEAPVWMRTIGVEWLFRFASEPRRLWRRYLIGNLQFIYAVLSPKADRLLDNE